MTGLVTRVRLAALLAVALAASAVDARPLVPQKDDPWYVAAQRRLAEARAVRRIDVVSAEEMYRAVEEEIGGVDAAVMAAAVADEMPAKTACNAK